MARCSGGDCGLHCCKEAGIAWQLGSLAAARPGDLVARWRKYIVDIMDYGIKNWESGGVKIGNLLRVTPSFSLLLSFFKFLPYFLAYLTYFNTLFFLFYYFVAKRGSNSE